MAILIAVYIVVAMLALAIGYLINVPIPKGYCDPWQLRAIMAVLKLIRLKDSIMEYFHIQTSVDSLLAARNFMIPSNDKGIASLSVKVEDIEFDGVKVRMYKPSGLRAENNPGIIFYHGGGWMSGNIEFNDDYCRIFSHEASTVMISVEYRLAPEHPYPAPLDDCVKATIHFIKEAAKYGVDQTRIAVMGDSSGGNLAAATSLKLRDLKVEPQPKLQVLIYPCLQAMDFQSPSYQANFHDPVLPAHIMAKFWLIYAAGNTKYINEVLQNKHVPLDVKKELALKQLNHQEVFKERKDINNIPYEFSQEEEQIWQELKDPFLDPYFSPLMSKDLRRLPEAIILTAEQDVLKDDGIWFAKYLEKFGIKVSHEHFESGCHGFAVPMFPDQENTKQARRYIVTQVTSRL